jgi:hypothetical protein
LETSVAQHRCFVVSLIRGAAEATNDEMTGDRLKLPPVCTPDDPRKLLHQKAGVDLSCALRIKDGRGFFQISVGCRGQNRPDHLASDHRSDDP